MKLCFRVFQHGEVFLRSTKKWQDRYQFKLPINPNPPPLKELYLPHQQNHLRKSDFLARCQQAKAQLQERHGKCKDLTKHVWWPRKTVWWEIEVFWGIFQGLSSWGEKGEKTINLLCVFCMTLPVQPVHSGLWFLESSWHKGWLQIQTSQMSPTNRVSKNCPLEKAVSRHLSSFPEVAQLQSEKAVAVRVCHVPSLLEDSEGERYGSWDGPCAKTQSYTQVPAWEPGVKECKRYYLELIVEPFAIHLHSCHPFDIV